MREIQDVLDTYLAARVAQVTPARFAAVPVNSAEIDTDDITVMGEYAFAHGHFLLERVVNGEPVRFDGKFLTILKQQADGSWKIFRDCSNSNAH